MLRFPVESCQGIVLVLFDYQYSFNYRFVK